MKRTDQGGATPVPGQFFFTELDPQARDKGSRDPLGFQTIWGYFGRKLVGNLTTITTSPRGFTTLILAHYFARQLVEDDRIEEENLVDAFLRFEQLVAYSRIVHHPEEAQDEESVRGVTRARKNLELGKGRVLISSGRDGQILSNQKTYGLWGFYTVASISSGILREKGLLLTPEALDHSQSLATRALSPKVCSSLLRFLEKDGLPFETKGKDSTLCEGLAAMHSKQYSKQEKTFYTRHLLAGQGARSDPTEGRQIRFWAMMEEVNDKNGWWGVPFGMMEAKSILALAKRSSSDIDRQVADVLSRAIDLERVLTPSERAFDLLLSMDGQTQKAAAGQIGQQWGKGLGHIDPDAVVRLADWIRQSQGENEGGVAARLVALARYFASGDFLKAVSLLREQNEVVMKRRGGRPWVVQKGKLLEVNFRDEVGDLPTAKNLPGLWGHSFFFDPLKAIGRSVHSKGGRS